MGRRSPWRSRTPATSLRVCGKRGNRTGGRRAYTSFLRCAARGETHQPRRARRSGRSSVQRTGCSRVCSDRQRRRMDEGLNGRTPGNGEPFEALLRYMRDSRGFDFTGYKRTSLMRRVRHRMDSAGYETFEEYLDVLQASSDEFAALFNTILINVTAFFRDP